MSVFDRMTPEGLNDEYLKEHADIYREFHIGPGKGEVWRIDYAGVRYCNLMHTDFWNVYHKAVDMVRLELRLTHKKGAACIKVNKHIDACDLIKIQKIFLNELEKGDSITFEGKKLYACGDHSAAIRPIAKYISGAYPIYKYKLFKDESV